MVLLSNSPYGSDPDWTSIRNTLSFSVAAKTNDTSGEHELVLRLHTLHGDHSVSVSFEEDYSSAGYFAPAWLSYAPVDGEWTLCVVSASQCGTLKTHRALLLPAHATVYSRFHVGPVVWESGGSVSEDSSSGIEVKDVWLVEEVLSPGVLSGKFGMLK